MSHKNATFDIFKVILFQSTIAYSISVRNNAALKADLPSFRFEHHSVASMTLRLKSIYWLYGVSSPVRLNIDLWHATMRPGEGMNVWSRVIFTVYLTLSVRAHFSCMTAWPRRRSSAKNNATPESLAHGCLSHVTRTSVCTISRK